MSLTTVRLGTLEYLKAENIGVPHCFTTRYGGVSTGTLASLNIGMHRGDDPKNVEENYRILGNALGIAPDFLVLTRQVHSDIVRKVGRADAAGLDHHTYPECDALITNEPGTGLVVFTADCTPILLWDEVTGAVGAIHAGWRGTASALAEKTVKAMVDAYGCDPANIRAAIGPNIASCCFETDGDVPAAMIAALGQEAQQFIKKTGEKYHVDLKGINEAFLRRAGVENIQISRECTCCEHNRFWSHRFTRGDRGSQGAIIVCKGEGR